MIRDFYKKNTDHKLVDEHITTNRVLFSLKKSNSSHWNTIIFSLSLISYLIQAELHCLDVPERKKTLACNHWEKKFIFKCFINILLFEEAMQKMKQWASMNSV